MCSFFCWKTLNSNELKNSLPKKKRISEIKSELNAKDDQVRLKAIYELRLYKKLDSELESAIINALEDKNTSIRYYAASTLACKGSKKSIPKLIQLLKDKDKTLRVFSAHALISLGFKDSLVAKVLVEGLKNTPHVSLLTTDLLCKMGLTAKDSIPALYEIAYKNPDFKKRVLAARAIWHITGDNQKIVPILISILQDSRQGASQQAALLLGEIGPPAKEAIPTLIKKMRAYDNKKLGIILPGYKATALWEIGSDSLPYLLELLENEHDDVRKHAVIAIGMIGSEAKSAIPILKKALKNEKEKVKNEIFKSIQRIENRIRGLIPDPPIKLAVNIENYPEKVEVVIENLCPEEIKFWEEDGSLGYYNYTFLIKDSKKGDEHVIMKRPINFTADLQGSYILRKYEKKRLFFNLKDMEWGLDGYWAIPEEALKKGEGRFIKVKYEILRKDDARILRVFMGKVESDWVELKQRGGHR